MEQKKPRGRPKKKTLEQEAQEFREVKAIKGTSHDS